MSSLAQRLLKSAGPKSLATIMKTSDFGSKDVITTTKVFALNVLMQGALDGGIVPGITQIVGDSRTFKSNLLVELAYWFLMHDDEAVVVVFDCEFGILPIFEKRCPELMHRVIHVPFEDLEGLKFQLTGMLEDTKRGEKVMFLIDSISQVASKKEVKDVLDEKAVADMTRAKEFNSFFRIITPKLNLRNIPLFAINSFYDDTTNEYAEPIIKGGKQAFLSSDAIWFVTRSQDKDEDTKELLGWNFNYTTMKSRFVKEKAKISVHVTYKGGIDPLSGIVGWARESGYLLMPTSGFYQFNKTLLPGAPDKKFRMKELMADPSLFDETTSSPGFQEYVKKKYALTEQALGVRTEDIDQETGEIK